MSYNFDQTKFLFFLSKWERSQYFVGTLMVLIFSLYSIPSVLENNSKGVLLMFVGFCYFFSILVIKWFILESKSINRFISLLEIDNSSIKLSTASFSTLFGIMNKKSINLEISKADIHFELAKPKYPMNNKYLGVVYIIRVAEKEYYLVENLFDDFESLKKNLERAISS